MNDTREQLERSIDRFLGSWTGWSVSIKVLREAIIGWLDRQAAITERETSKTYNKSVENVTDSREKLETDLRSLTVSWRDYDGNYMRIYSSVAYAQIKELLERQAVITADANKELIEWQAATVVRLQKEVDELTDSYEASSRALEILTLDKAELQTQLKSICTHLAIEAEGKPDILASLAIASIDALISERDNLASDLEACMNERETWREAYGKALDKAHEIQRIMDGIGR